MSRRSVAVRIAGQTYRIRSDADEDWLHEVAACVDGAMAQIRDRTGAVDSLDVAMLTCLNMAREVLVLRGRLEDETSAFGGADVESRVQAMIELVETTLGSSVPGSDSEGDRFGSSVTPDEIDQQTTAATEADAGQAKAELLTLPAGSERADAGGAAEGLIGPLVGADSDAQGADSAAHALLAEMDPTAVARETG